MEKYSEYKDSGVEWLGEIPSHWSLLPGKSLYKENKNKNDGVDHNVLSLSYGNIIIKKNVKEGLVPENYESYQLIQPGNIVIRCTDLQNDKVSLRTAISKYKGIITSAYLALIPNGNIVPKYLHYLLRNWDNTKELYRYGSGLRQSLSWLDFKNLQLPVPSLSEQQTIAVYLDSQTVQIDEAIAQQQKMIDLLNERKQIIINNAVTKGLDPNVPIKDSGVDWIGMIPEHWEVMKTLYILSMPITDGPHTTPHFYESGIPFISAEAVSCGNGKIDFSHMRGYISESFYKECCKKYIPQKGDIYMIKSGATTGKIAIVDTDRMFTIWSPLAVFRCNSKIMISKYLFYVLQSTPFKTQVEIGWTYGTQQNIGMRSLERILLAVPNIEEQAQLANLLDCKISKINNVINGRQKQITLLQERKQIIINEVVTGKIKVS